jgi:hypothetical protein
MAQPTSPVPLPKTPKPSRTALKHLRASDLAAVAQLATQATVGATRMAEGVHQSVWGTLGVAGAATPATTGGLTGLIYSAVRGVTHAVGKGLQATFKQLQPLLDAADHQSVESPEREAVLAALNGVLGDQLQASQNPLATPMSLRYRGRAVTKQFAPTAEPWPAEAAHAAADNAQPAKTAGHPDRFDSPHVTGKILLLVHGLCMNDLQWSTPVHPTGAPHHNHGTALAESLGYTPVFVRYNSGLHISDNGQELARQIGLLLKSWPVAVTGLSVVAHSMGGLVIRSAAQLAERDALSWRQHLERIVFLGTPHHGAPLERAGNWVDEILGSTPYSRPFAKLGQLRSAGITDLRYGHVMQADWLGHDRFHKRPDSRIHVPLPKGVGCYTVAATLADKWAPASGALTDNLVGDGLVPLPSALGHHAQVGRRLAFAPNNRRVLYATHHMALLSSPLVTQQLIAWLA